MAPSQTPSDQSVIGGQVLEQPSEFTSSTMSEDWNTLVTAALQSFCEAFGGREIVREEVKESEAGYSEVRGTKRKRDDQQTIAEKKYLMKKVNEVLEISVIIPTLSFIDAETETNLQAAKTSKEKQHIRFLASEEIYALLGRMGAMSCRKARKLVKQRYRWSVWAEEVGALADKYGFEGI